jgi:tripartite-type tricarboxylate transporter receptor subunit TctC
VARFAGNGLSGVWKQSVVIENRPGAGGVVGATYVAQREPDGYTQMIWANVLTIPIFNKDIALKPHEDLAPISMVAGAPNVLVGSVKLGAHTLKDLIDVSKTRTIVLNIIPYSAAHVKSLYFFKKVMGIDVNAIPYNSTAQATQALVAGDVDLDWSLVQATRGLIESGRLIPIGVTAPQRDPRLPGVPTFRELGYDYDSGFWFGFYGPKGFAPDLANKIAADYARVFGSKEAAETLDKLGMSPRIGGPDVMMRTMLDEEKQLKEAAAAINLAPR